MGGVDWCCREEIRGESVGCHIVLEYPVCVYLSFDILGQNLSQLVVISCLYTRFAFI